MATKPWATERDLGKIEMQLTVARTLLMKAGLQLERLGHEDSAATLARISRQLRRLRTTVRKRIGDPLTDLSNPRDGGRRPQNR